MEVRTFLEAARYRACASRLEAARYRACASRLEAARYRACASRLEAARYRACASRRDCIVYGCGLSALRFACSAHPNNPLRYMSSAFNRAAPAAPRRVLELSSLNL